MPALSAGNTPHKTLEAEIHGAYPAPTAFMLPIGNGRRQRLQPAFLNEGNRPRIAQESKGNEYSIPDSLCQHACTRTTALPMSSAFTGWAGAILLGLALNGIGEQFRTDINPALLYYQAFLLEPTLTAGDKALLGQRGTWDGQALPARVGELARQYDDEFRLLRQAAQAQRPCDWGIDMSPGPTTPQPHMRQMLGVIQAARLRTLWHLQQDHSAEACADLSAAFAFGRNLSRDGMLIGLLGQIAIEAIVCQVVADNFGRFSAAGLGVLMATLDCSPARGTLAAAIAAEKGFYGPWVTRQIRELQKEHAGEESAVMEGIRRLLGEPDNNEESAEFWNAFARAAGGTSEGVLKLLEQFAKAQPRFDPLWSLPYREYVRRLKELRSESGTPATESPSSDRPRLPLAGGNYFVELLFQSSANPSLSYTFPAWEKTRAKEFRSQVLLAMVHAATQYKLQHGPSGLQTVTDPCGPGPFAFERVTFEGVDRGFLLRSAYDWNGRPTTLTFLEKPGNQPP
jgi:hypothetical protein